MALIKTTSLESEPEYNKTPVTSLMFIAIIPGLFALTLFFGWGSLLNITIASITAIIFEVIILKLRKREVIFHLKDHSVLLTALLLAISLPPLTPWWIPVIGIFFSVVIAKNLYGVHGYHPFNPAMVGYAVLLISFPIQMTAWPAPISMDLKGIEVPGLWQSIKIVFPIFTLDASNHLTENILNQVDAYTAATPLDIFRQNSSFLIDRLYKDQLYFMQGIWAGYGWEWINICFFLGGCFLLYQKILTWHIPLGILGSLIVLSSVFYDGGSSSSLGSPIFHLLSGATMLGAFFIASDPVTSPNSFRGKLLYGILIGILIFIIRSWGSYPDAIAFAVLIMNFFSPLIDRLTRLKGYE
jgi:electron transport complex protein RnfD